MNIKNKSFKHRFYWIFKKMIFPASSFLELIPDAGTILDIGCGNGTFTSLISQKYPKSKVMGIDADKNKINIAKERYSSVRNLDFKVLDLMHDHNLPVADLYIFIDVLYLLPLDIQEKLIHKICSIMGDKSTLIIKECCKSINYKYLCNYIHDTIFVKIIGYTHGQSLYNQRKEDMVEMLKRQNLSVRIIKLDKGYLYPHIVYYCKKELVN